MPWVEWQWVPRPARGRTVRVTGWHFCRLAQTLGGLINHDLGIQARTMKPFFEEGGQGD